MVHAVDAQVCDGAVAVAADELGSDEGPELLDATLGDRFGSQGAAAFPEDCGEAAIVEVAADGFWGKAWQDDDFDVEAL